MPDEFPGGHNYTFTVGDTVHASMIQGGIDYNCGSLYKTNLYNTIKDGSANLTETQLDVSVGRILRTMIQVSEGNCVFLHSVKQPSAMVMLLFVQLP